ncbi:hypothetical protein RHMOL_Rhmol04G0144700 [Rhododendron molle]|uniref:Uncharacterized protein n=1 Tax=Rhododendron molle TaxID=49168 RepID=A0ACC0P2J1_RHOML|nr:hypothetical protein RHMOL_Rhmol04G0144700 [Rhododendron molle]
MHLRQPTAALLREVSATARRVVVIHDFLMAYVVQDVGCSTPEFQNLVSLQYDFLSLGAGIIFNSCRSIEGTYIDLVAKIMNNRSKKIWAVGPLNRGKTSDRRESNSRHKCLEWLDKQVPKSVLYVSFGTATSMADEQIKELAIGLEQSKQKFIWILRDADRGDIFAGDVKRTQLPEGYS